MLDETQTDYIGDEMIQAKRFLRNFIPSEDYELNL